MSKSHPSLYPIFVSFPLVQMSICSQKLCSSSGGHSEPSTVVSNGGLSPSGTKTTDDLMAENGNFLYLFIYFLCKLKFKIYFY